MWWSGIRSPHRQGLPESFVGDILQDIFVSLMKGTLRTNGLSPCQPVLLLLI